MMETIIVQMAQKLGLQNAVLSGQDADAVADVIFGAYCQMMKIAKHELACELSRLEDMPHASKIFGVHAIKNDVNYLWGKNAS